MHSVILPDLYNSHGPSLTTGSFLRRTLLLSVFALASLAVPLTTRGQNTNTAYGTGALIDPSLTGIDNTAIGFSALTADTSGSYNTAVGAFTLEGNSTGQQNTAIGEEALGEGNGNYSTATGFEALVNNSGNYNVADGWRALYSNNSGEYNTASGSSALHENTFGVGNTAIGTDALFYNNSGNNNTASGLGALLNNTTGSNNVALGYQAGFNLNTGNNNIIIGAGLPGKAGEANTTRIGKTTQAAVYIGGIYNKSVSSKTTGGGVPVLVDSSGKLGTVKSSARYKNNIKPMDKTSEAILQLEPVTFRYKQELDPDGATQFGLIAEQVEKIDPDLIVRGEDGKVETVRYDAVNAMLLNEFLKEHGRVEQQDARLAKQEAIIAKQQKQLETLTAGLQKVNAEMQLSEPAQETAATDQ